MNPNRSSCSLRERTEKSHKMSQYTVPNWNLKHQRQEQVEGEEGNRSSHVHNQQQNHSSSTSLVPNMYALPFLCYYIFFLCCAYGVIIASLERDPLASLLFIYILLMVLCTILMSFCLKKRKLEVHLKSHITFSLV